MKQYFISIQATYSHTEIALFNGESCIQHVINTESRASSHLVILITDILQKHSLFLEDLAFLALDKGPGAFTSLRVSLATVNGVAFTGKLPLVGIDGLDALSMQALEQFNATKPTRSPKIVVSLLNAYNNDVYYAVTTTDTLSVQEKGCKNINELIVQLKNAWSDQPILFTGNGFQLHEGLIREAFGESVIESLPALQTASALQIGTMAYKMVKQDNNCLSYKIEPLYLKTQYFAIKNKPSSTSNASD